MQFVTILILLDFLVLAVYPPRLHYGIRFLAMLFQAAVMWLLGAYVVRDFYLPVPFAPPDFLFNELDLSLLSLVCFALGFVTSVVAWVARKLIGWNAEAAA